MASIRPYQGKWRAEIERHGTRKSKLCETEAEARLWAAHAEDQLDAQKRRYAPRDQFAMAGPNLVTVVPRCVLEACREIPHRQSDVLANAIPVRLGSAVYFLMSKGEVIYVGQSNDVLSRLARHRREGKQFDAFACIECKPEEMDRLETLYIKAFVPEENLTFGNHRAPGLSPRTKRRARLTVAKDDSVALMSAPPQETPAA
jgi:hypothetical protein